MFLHDVLNSQQCTFRSSPNPSDRQGKEAWHSAPHALEQV